MVRIELFIFCLFNLCISFLNLFTLFIENATSRVIIKVIIIIPKMYKRVIVDSLMVVGMYMLSSQFNF